MAQPQPIIQPEIKEDIEGSEVEGKLVHQVYDKIATHFSSTRYKAWPVVENFLNGREKGSLGADVGCGNGKYLNVNKDVLTLGSDYCKPLLSESKGFEIPIVADNLNLPYRTNAFDFVISIAVVHHFSTKERRTQAVKELLRIVKPQGSILIFVWALEQQGKRKFDKNHQDVLVPWVLQPKFQKGETTTDEKKEPEVFHRYYHLFKEQELMELVENSGFNFKIMDKGYDRDNWYIVVQKS